VKFIFIYNRRVKRLQHCFAVSGDWLQNCVNAVSATNYVNSVFGVPLLTVLFWKFVVLRGVARVVSGGVANDVWHSVAREQVIKDFNVWGMDRRVYGSGEWCKLAEQEHSWIRFWCIFRICIMILGEEMYSWPILAPWWQLAVPSREHCRSSVLWRCWLAVRKGIQLIKALPEQCSRVYFWGAT